MALSQKCLKRTLHGCLGKERAGGAFHARDLTIESLSFRAHRPAEYTAARASVMHHNSLQFCDLGFERLNSNILSLLSAALLHLLTSSRHEGNRF